MLSIPANVGVYLCTIATDMGKRTPGTGDPGVRLAGGLALGLAA